MSRRNELTSSDAVFGPFGGLAAALTETAVMTPLTLRLLHARQLHSSSVQADRHLRADLMRHAEAGLIELQHSIHLARQCGEHPVSDESLAAETALREARALLPGGAAGDAS